MAKRIILDPAVLAAGAEAYATGGPKALAAATGMSVSSAYRLKETLGIALKRPRRPRPPPAPEPEPAYELPSAEAPIRLRLERLLAHRIGALEREAAAGVAVDPEANARALTANARTLALLRRLPPDPHPEAAAHDEPPPRSLAELRDELRRHLERIAAEERARRIRERADAIRGREAARALADPLPAGPASA